MSNDKERVEAGKPEVNEAAMSEREIDLNLIETFPASDPPSWTLGTDHQDEPTDAKSNEDREVED